MYELYANKNVIIDPKHWIFRVTVTDKKKDSLVIEYPCSLNFDVTRNTFAETNSGTFTLTNLSASSRQFCFKDRLNVGEQKGIIVEAGYEGQLSKIFQGLIMEGYSQREGTEILTNMLCWDVTMDSDVIARTFEAGTTKREAYKSIANQAGLEIANIGELRGEFKQPTTFVGTPLNILNQITNGNTFIDNGQVNTLFNTECLKGVVMVLNSSTGLLGTPQRRETQVIVESVFRPEIKVGQLLEIDSEISPEFSGTYFVVGINHSGTISPTKSGKRTTTLNLMNAYTASASNVNVTEETKEPQINLVEGEKITPVNGKYGSSVEEVYRYIQDHNGDVTGLTKKITERISWREMLCPIVGGENTPEQILSQVTKEILYNCEEIATKLTNFLNGSIYKGQRIIILSGWRSKETNAKWDNASTESAHLRGSAIDFKFENVNTYTAFYKAFQYNWDRFTYLYRIKTSYSYQIHVQSSFGKGGAKR